MLLCKHKEFLNYNCADFADNLFSAELFHAPGYLCRKERNKNINSTGTTTSKSLTFHEPPSFSVTFLIKTFVPGVLGVGCDGAVDATLLLVQLMN